MRRLHLTRLEGGKRTKSLIYLKSVREKSKLKGPEVGAGPVAQTNMEKASVAGGEGTRGGIVHNVLKG